MHTNLYFAWTAWITLVLIVMVRPLNDFLNKQALSKIVVRRKTVAWICIIAVLLHILLFSYRFKMPLTFIFKPSSWDFSTAFGWGLLAFAIMIPLAITSNKFSIILLKKNWKRLQRLTYVFFIASAIHIYLIGGKWPLTLLPLGIWIVLWTASYLKKRSNCK